MAKGSVSVEVNISKVLVDDFRGWNGPVGKSMKRLANQVVIASKVAAPKKTGVMAAKINYKKQSGPAGIQFSVTSPARQSMWMEKGTRPHPITPKRPGGTLVFYWPKVGQTVFFKKVSHPGTRAYKFMERGLAKGMAVWRVTG